MFMATLILQQTICTLNTTVKLGILAIFTVNGMKN